MLVCPVVSNCIFIYHASYLSPYIFIVIIICVEVILVLQTLSAGTPLQDGRDGSVPRAARVAEQGCVCISNLAQDSSINCKQLKAAGACEGRLYPILSYLMYYADE
jgi:hypothetical protein